MANCLWRDRKSGLHLMGAVHYLPAATPFPLVFDEAFAGAEVVVFESKFDQKRDLDLGSLPRGSRLERILPPDLLAALVETASMLGTDPSELMELRPWAVVFNLTKEWVRFLEADSALGVDNYYFRRAGAEGKTMQALEHIDFLPRQFNVKGLGLQIQYLKDFTEQVARGKDFYLRIIDSWSHGDLSAFMEIAAGLARTCPEVSEFVLGVRNRNWATRLRELRRRKGSSLAIVGMLHLAGPGSVLELLEAKGADFEQI